MVWSGLVDLVLAKPLFLKVKMNSIFTKQWTKVLEYSIV